MSTQSLRSFLIEPERILPNKHHKQPLILNRRSLGACRVRQCPVSVCWFHPNQASEEKLYLARRQYTDGEQRQEKEARGEAQDNDFGCMCVGTRRKYRRKVQKTQRNLFGNLAWKLSVHTHTHTHTHTRTHTHTYIHTFYHSWQILDTTHQKGAIKVCCVQSSKRLRPSHQLAATHCAHRAEGRVHRRAACVIKKKLGHHFSISKRPEGSKSVLCPVFVQLCPSHQLAASHCVHAAGRAACEISTKSVIFSITQFGSPTAQIPLESGSSTDKRFRTDLKIFNKNCIIYVSQADVQNDDGFIKPFEVKPSWSRVYPLFCFFSSVTKEFNQSEACSHILRWKPLQHPSACSWALNTAARQKRKHQLITKPRAWIFPTDRAAHKHMFGPN